MPNWCEGVLKVRGTRENIVKFLTEGLEIVDFSGESCGFINVLPRNPEFPDEIIIDTGTNNNNAGIFYSYWEIHMLWIKGSKRHFVDLNARGTSFFNQSCKIDSWDGSDKDYIWCGWLRAAWDIDSSLLLKMCKEYHLDMNIEAYECGMAFVHSIMIVNGEIKIENHREFENYIWTCSNPFLGG